MEGVSRDELAAFNNEAAPFMTATPSRSFDQRSRLARSAQPESSGAQVDHPETNGYCALLSADWWLISAALLMVLATLSFGSLPIVGFLACTGAVCWRNPGLAGRTLYLYAPLLLIPLYAMASAAWSDAPSASLKQGAELLLFFAAALVLSRRVSAEGFAAALLGPAVLICAASLAAQPSALLGAPLHGLLGSKNILAFVAQALTGCALAVLFSPGIKPALRLLALFGLALGVLEVVLARSAGAWVTTVVMVAAFLAMSLADRVSLGARLAVIIAGVLAAIPLALAHEQISAAIQDFQVHVLHKDATLTGRTGLWEVAHSLIAERPILGHGYSAFWQQGNLDAEALWRTMGIAARSGFNFHNQFIEVLVDYGYAGLILFCVVIAYVGVCSLVRVTWRPSPAAAFFAAMVIALYTKLPVESALISPWNIFTLVWLAAGVHAVSPVQRTVASVFGPRLQRLGSPRTRLSSRPTPA